MNIEFPLNGLTWKDLRALVSVGAHFDDSTEVEFGTDDSCEIVALAIYGLDPDLVVPTNGA